MKGFVEKLFLQNPDELSIDNAYRSLPRLGDMAISVNAVDLGATLKSLEKTGFVGMTIAHFSSEDTIRKIQAFKGKHGPCYDKGQQVIYNGTAAAALDDDHHLLIKSQPIPVCEKTANVLSMNTYKHLVGIIQPGKKAFHDKQKYFSYDYFEEDQEKLFEKVSRESYQENRIPLFYPGPFKILILSDGTMVRRGQVSNIPVSESNALIKKEGLFRGNDQPSEKNEFFQEVFPRVGSKWMYENLTIAKKSSPPVNADFLSLQGISENMKKRLSKLIENKNNYFVLTGSDPADRLGCCPSDDVAEANRLVQCGILESCSQDNYLNACPVTFYAFKGEIKSKDGEVKFQPADKFRKQISEMLGQRSRKGINIVKWFILAFVVVSVLFGIYKKVLNSAQVQDHSFYERLAPAEGHQIMVLLFHYHKRCYQCLNMEKYTRDVLLEDFQDEAADNRVDFKLIDMDAPENRPIIKQFGFISAMIVLVDFENGKERRVKVIADAWKLFNDEQDFKSLMRKELNQFISESDE